MTLVIVLSLSMALAIDPGQGSFTEADNGTYDASSADVLSATGGNIFSADIDSNVSTIRWAGLSGSVTGSIILADSSNNILYDWGAATPVAVYATLAADTIAWSTGLSNGVEGDFETDFPYLDVLLAPNDDYASTFSGSTDISAVSNLFSPAACPSVLTENNTNGAFWVTAHCQDAGAQTVMIGVVQENRLDYAGATVDFQMIIPELGGQGETAATDWDLWVELE